MCVCAYMRGDRDIRAKSVYILLYNYILLPLLVFHLDSVCFVPPFFFILSLRLFFLSSVQIVPFCLFSSTLKKRLLDPLPKSILALYSYFSYILFGCIFPKFQNHRKLVLAFLSKWSNISFSTSLDSFGPSECKV